MSFTIVMNCVFGGCVFQIILLRLLLENGRNFHFRVSTVTELALKMGLGGQAMICT